MTYKFSEEDVRDARPNALPIAETDVEISVGTQADDITLWVNKGRIQILRVRLNQAGADLSAAKLMQFSTFAPDFVFTIGDSAEGLDRVRRSLGFADPAPAGMR